MVGGCGYGTCKAASWIVSKYFPNPDRTDYLVCLGAIVGIPAGTFLLIKSVEGEPLDGDGGMY